MYTNNQIDLLARQLSLTTYAIVEARNESEVKETVPAFLGGKARVVKLNQFTAEQIREFHKKTA